MALLLLISGRTPKALDEATRSYIDFINKLDDRRLAATCIASAARRTHHECRLAVVAPSRALMLEALEAKLREEEHRFVWSGRPRRGAEPTITFWFGATPAESLWSSLPQLIVDHPALSQILDRHEDVVSRHVAWSLDYHFRIHGFSEPPAPEVARPGLFVIQAALADLLRFWNVMPLTITGEGDGELAVAYASGALTFEETLHLATTPAKVSHASTPSGSVAEKKLIGQAGADESADESALVLAVASEGQVALPVEAGESASLLPGLASLHVRGVEIAWSRVFPHSSHTKLPSYPFQRKRFWWDDVGGVPLPQSLEARQSDPPVPGAARQSGALKAGK